MAVVIVGATGVLGRALVPLIEEHGQRVRALVRSPDRAHELLGADVEVCQFDLLAPDAEASLLRLVSPGDAVVHIATAIPQTPRSERDWEVTAASRTVVAPGAS